MRIKYRDKVYEVDELLVIMPNCVSPQRVRADEVQVVADEIVITGQRFVPVGLNSDKK